MDLVNLTPQFRVFSYSGATQAGYEDDLGIERALDGDNKTKHCSGKGFNHDLLLQFDQDVFTMTHFIALGALRCTAPLKTAVVFVLDSPDFSTFGSDFDDCESEEEFQRLKAANAACRDLTGFILKTNSKYFCSATSCRGSGKFVYIKFIRPHDEDNIDVGAVTIIGFSGADDGESEISEDLPEAFSEFLREPPCGSVRTDSASNHTIESILFCYGDTLPFVVAIASGEEDAEKEALQSVFSEVFMSEEFRTQVAGLVMGRDEEGVAAKLRKRVKLDRRLAAQAEPAAVVYAYDENGGKFMMDVPDDEEGISVERVSAFARQVQLGEAQRFFTSADRPEGDADPEHPGVTILVRDSFDELVLDEEGPDCFVDVYADWCFPCKMLAPVIANVAKLFHSEDVGIRICKFDSGANDTPRALFPEPFIPNLKFFPTGDKRNPIKYEGPRNAEALVRWIHEHATTKFDLDSLLGRAAEMRKNRSFRMGMQALLRSITKDMAVFPDEESEDRTRLEEFVASVSVTLEQPLTKDIRDDVGSQFEAMTAPMRDLSRRAKEVRNKKVVVVWKVPELDEQVDGAPPDMLVAVDMYEYGKRAEAFGLVYAEMSVTFEDSVRFVRMADYNKIKKAKKKGLDAERFVMEDPDDDDLYPRFRFYKNGAFLEELQQANAETLLERIEELK